MRTTLPLRLLSLAGALVVTLAVMTAGGVAKDRVYAPGGVALNGYDPVAYFTEKRAIKCDEAFTYTYNGVEWRFAKKAHLEEFKESPEKYLPKYGGFDAYMMAKDTMMRVDGEAFLVEDGALFLFKNKALKEKFAKDMRRKVAYANHYWKKQ